MIKKHRTAPLPRHGRHEVAARKHEEHDVPFSSHLRHIFLWGLALLGVALVLPGRGPCEGAVAAGDVSYTLSKILLDSSGWPRW